jgi:predicted  nucleic acid-binding Zn-ribbon protein
MGRGTYHGGSTLIGPRSTGWVGRGSPTMQPASKKKGRAAPKRKNQTATRPKHAKAAAPPSAKGNGLTIAEKVARARRKVEAIRAEIAKTRKRLVDLDRELGEAERSLELARSLPRRSALGKALAEANLATEKA